MESKSDEINSLVEHLFRQEAGKLIAILTRAFGIHNIELAEDVVQDTLISALHNWSVKGVPENPAAWLTRVAKNKAINQLKHKSSFQKQQVELRNQIYDDNSTMDKIFMEDEIKDSQLRMIFACCHPQLKLESQIALTLKTLGGFGVQEIARALLSNKSTINKRLYRAKEKFRKKEIEFEIPSVISLDSRLRSVYLTLYLMFNEGYNSSSSDELIQRELCLEALRLTKLLIDKFDSPEVNALAALMCFHIARFDSRIDKKGGIILFEDQDRNKWDKRLIAIGVKYLTKSKKGSTLSDYHIEAAIAAEHCLAPNFEQTAWDDIYSYYRLLYQMKKNPVILLNLAIIKSQIHGYGASIEELDKLANNKEMVDYHLLHVTRGIFSLRINRAEEAKDHLTKALNLTTSEMEKSFIQGRIKACEEMLNELTR